MVKVISIFLTVILLTILFSILSPAQTLIWERKIEGEIISTALTDLDGDDSLDTVVISDGGGVYGVSGSSGEILWSFPTGEEDISPPALADLNGDKIWDILFATSQGRVYILDGPSGDKISDFKVGDEPIPYVAALDLDGDGVSEILTFDAEGGINSTDMAARGLWGIKMGSSLGSSPQFADLNNDKRPDIVTGLTDGSVHALGGVKGESLWSFKIGVERTSILALGDLGGDGVADILVTSGDSLSLIAGASGERLWEIKITSPVKSAAIVSPEGEIESWVLLASDDGVRALDGIEGSVSWNFAPEGGATWVSTKPGEESVIVFSPNGAIHQLTSRGLELLNYSLSQPPSIPILAGDLDRSGRLSVVSAHKDFLFHHKTAISLASDRVLEGGVMGSDPEASLDYYASPQAFAARESARSEALSATVVLAEEHYRNGEGHLKAREWTLAIEAFRKTLERYPDYKKEDVRRGIATAEDRLRESEDLYTKGLRDFDRRRWRGAIEFLRGAVVVTPGHSDAGEKIKQAQEELARAHAYYLTGLRFVEEGMTQEAVLQLRTALDVDPGHEEAKKLLREIGNLGTILIVALTTVIGGGTALYLVLWFRGGERRLGERIDRLEEELGKDPARVDVLAELSTLLLKVGRYDDGAVKVYEDALATGYNQDRLTQVLASIYLEDGREDEAALEIYERALKTSPQEEELLKAVGNIYLDQEREGEGALWVYERLSEIVEDEYLDRMLAYLYGKKEIIDDRAMRVYAKALSYNPNDFTLVSFLIQIHLIRHEPDQAAEMCRRGLSLTPEEKEEKRVQETALAVAFSRTADMYTENGRFSEAIDTLEYASVHLPESVEIDDKLLRLYEDRSTGNSGDDRSNRIKLARIYREKGKVDQAIAKLESLPLSDVHRRIDYVLEMGKCLTLKDKAKTAIRLIEQTLEGQKVNEETQELYYDLALAYQQEGLDDKYNITLGKIMVYDLDYKDVVQRVGKYNRQG